MNKPPRPRVAFSLTLKIALLVVVTMALGIVIISDLVARSVHTHTIAHLTEELEITDCAGMCDYDDLRYRTLLRMR